jgi:hypothetical protein
MLAGAACRLLEQIQMLSPVNRVAMRDRRSRIVPRMGGAAQVASIRTINANARTTANLNARLSGSCAMSASGHQSVDVDVQLYGGNLERCVNCVTLARNRRSPMQPHSFSRQMSAWDETGAGLFGEALTAFIPAASSLPMRRYDVRAEIIGRAR